MLAGARNFREIGDQAPGQGALYHPAAEQDLEGAQVIGPLEDLEREFQREAGRGPCDQLAGVAAVGSGKLHRRECLAQVPQQQPAASRSCTLAALTRSVSSRPIVSTAMCRLRPFIFFRAS